MNRDSLNRPSTFKLALRKIGIIAIVVGALVFSGCGSNTTPPPSAQAQGKLYVAEILPSSTSEAIVRFDDPSTLSGNVSPAAIIAGALTRLGGFGANLALDAKADRLFALVSTGPATAAILVFDHISTKAGNLAPDRVIEGSATGLSAMGPLVLDDAKDILYAESAFDSGGNWDVLVFKNASTLNGNIPPSSILQVEPAGIAAADMVLDAGNNRLFVLMNDQTVSVFDNASDIPTGPMIPDRVIAGPSTGIQGAFHIALDPSGRLLVANLSSPSAPNSILIFPNAATANGDVAPVATISGSATGLNVGGPGAMAVVTGPGASPGGDLYVNVELGTVLVFKNINSANGNIAPDHSFSVGRQGSVDLAFAVDPTR